jgi:hypothetical protein
MVFQSDFSNQTQFKRTAQKGVGAKTYVPVERFTPKPFIVKIPDKVNANTVTKGNVCMYPAEFRSAENSIHRDIATRDFTKTNTDFLSTTQYHTALQQT